MSDDEEPLPFRTVTPPYRSRSDSEMNLISILYFLGLLIILIPLLPFIIVIWVVGKLTER